MKHEPNRACVQNVAASRVTTLRERVINNISRPLEEGEEK